METLSTGELRLLRKHFDKMPPDILWGSHTALSYIDKNITDCENRLNFMLHKSPL